MEQKRTVIIGFAFLLGALVWPSFVLATIDWDEGFEYADDAAFGKVWSYSCLGNPGITSERAHSGSKSVKLVYNGRVGVDPGAGGCFMTRNFNALTDTIFGRVWVYLLNFTADPVGTKMFSIIHDGHYPNFWVEQGSSNSMFVAVTGSAAGTHSVSGGSLPQNQWACLEWRISLNTPGVSNGIIQVWVNGVLSINRTDQLFRPASGTPPAASPSSRLQFTTIYVQHGLGTMYYDDYAVSRDARIGDSGIVVLPEYDPPALGQQVPAKGAVDIDPSADISFHLTDKTGVDQASIVLQVNGKTVQPAISGSPTDFAITCNPSDFFVPGSTVGVKVDAKDVLGNSMQQVFYTFKISSNTGMHPPARISAQDPVFLVEAAGQTTELIVNTLREGFWELRVVDVKGHCVKHLPAQALHAGSNRVKIDFYKGEAGRGVYFVVLKQGNAKNVFRVMMFK